MGHAGGCGCGYDDRAAAVAVRPGRHAGDERVGDVASVPGARAVLERFGVNHCCGADLTLRGGAAAAGVELAVLLRALDAVAQPA
jgi:iron-sulfur cluster repair protein YtfE (RIC family)